MNHEEIWEHLVTTIGHSKTSETFSILFLCYRILKTVLYIGAKLSIQQFFVTYQATDDMPTVGRVISYLKIADKVAFKDI